MHGSSLESLLYFLLAAVIFVPLFRGFRFGGILGYLFAGVLIGPEVLHLIDDPESVLHFSEIGVVLLLFIIGLELNPERLWLMRNQIGFLGGGQLLISALIITVACSFLDSWSVALAIGLALALSSTAFAVQLMAERGILASANGRRGLAILLMQDLAVIPILLIVQALADAPADHSQPWWHGVLAVTALLVCGRYLLDSLLSVIARFGSRETMTAMALLIVVGSAYLMDLTGLSMGLGAFVAGILLANSHFRHQLSTDIEPFKGLTLGLFFIAIGMTLNIDLLLAKPLLIILLALLLIVAKAAVIAGLLLFARVDWRTAVSLGLMLGQGGEFAFVIMSQAVGSQLLSIEQVSFINLMVGISMVLTVPLVSLFGKCVAVTTEESETSDPNDIDRESEVLILGFGRFGQITGRILAANKIPFTALDNNSSHINFIRRFGNKIHFGDITRLDVLQTAGIDKATTILIAIEDGEQAVDLIKIIREHYPDVFIVCRAYNRVNYLKLINAGASKVIRETFSGSLEAAYETLSSLGFTTSQALDTVDIFRQHDESLLERALEHHDDLEKVIEIGIQGRRELEELFKSDKDKIS